MPRPGPRSPTICLRLAPDTLARVDAAAQGAGVTRSAMIRSLLTSALAGLDSLDHGGPGERGGDTT